jgi:tetratricopeptide (TPR) repeat protein
MKLRLFLFAALISSLALFVACNEERSADSGALTKPPFKSFTDSIKSFPNDPRFYLGRALLLSQKNMHDLATADYRKAWELSGDEGVALEYASNLLLVNQPNEALNLLKECRQKFPENLEFNRRISELYAQMGKRAEALAEYDTIIGRDSLNFMAWYEKGLLLKNLRDTPAAIEALERSFAIQPIAYTGLALAELYSASQNPRLLQICDYIISKDSTGEMVDAIMLKGIYYSDKKEYNKALEHFEECIKRDWKFTQAHIEKGIVYFEQRDYANALATFQMATTVSNTNADTYYWLGRTYEAMNDKQQARENYERSLSLDPRVREAREALKRLP